MEISAPTRSEVNVSSYMTKWRRKRDKRESVVVPVVPVLDKNIRIGRFFREIVRKFENDRNRSTFLIHSIFQALQQIQNNFVECVQIILLHIDESIVHVRASDAGGISGRDTDYLAVLSLLQQMEQIPEPEITEDVASDAESLDVCQLVFRVLCCRK